jgi:hypothetical protein
VAKSDEQGAPHLAWCPSSGCDVRALDGMSYVVENNIDNSYRTYMYDNPQFSKCEEAKRIIEIANLFHDEFASQLPRQ